MSRSPLRGFNHNIRYRNRTYHVQTEDSGVDNPHIFTHLYQEGMIIASAKTDYSKFAADPKQEPRVVKMMQEQHKKLMKELRRGAYDDKILSVIGSLDPNDELSIGSQTEENAEAAAEASTKSAAAAAEAAAAETAAVEAAAAEAAVEAAAAEAAAAQAAAVAAAKRAAAARDQAEPAYTVDTIEYVDTPPPEQTAETTKAPPPQMDPLIGGESLEDLALQADADRPNDFADEAVTGVHQAKQRRQVRIRPPTVEPATVATPRDVPLISEELLPDATQPLSAADIERVQHQLASADPVFSPPRHPSQETEVDSAVVIDRPPDDWSEREQSGVFDSPLPKDSRLPTPAEMLEAVPPKRQAGVYPLPRPPHPDPTVRAQGKKPAASTPQRYTAPSRARSTSKMTHVTGAYRVPSSLQPVSEINRGQRVTGAQRGAQVNKTPPPGKVPVVARPAIILDGKSSSKKAPAQPNTSGRPPARRAQTSIRSMPNLFGSDLISERSLDEVILGYLAEEDGSEEGDGKK